MADRVEEVGAQVKVVCPPPKVAAELERRFISLIARERGERATERLQLLGLDVEVQRRRHESVRRSELDVPLRVSRPTFDVDTGLGHTQRLVI